MKPFKAPTVVRRTSSNTNHQPPPIQPPAKKRRISGDNDDGDEIDSKLEAIAATANILQCKPSSVKSFVPPPIRKPLDVVANSSSPSERSGGGADGEDCYYTVLWRKYTTKKNKTWDGDGVLSVRNGYATLQDISGKDLGKGVCKGPLLVGSELSIGGKEIEVEAMLSKKEYLAGRVFLNNAKAPSQPSLSEINQTDKVTFKQQAKHKKIALKQKKTVPTAAPATQATRTGFKAPTLSSANLPQKRELGEPTPRHDPRASGALVMKRLKSAPKGKRVVDVVVDPLITRKLREHQRVGVSFLYECVMGMKDYPGEGAVLADEMGVGKTLQTIALLWTLLKQNPIYEDPPVVKKALIVCPVSLINNWRKEFNKWLGRDRIGVFVAGDKYSRLTDFTMGKAYSVMIIGYEKLRTVQADLQKGSGIDIVIADEGHRLKTAQNKSAQAIKSLNTERRIILSGTPIQNDLTEFYTMVDFVNPGLLSKYTTFKREFETPILKSRQPGASASDIEKGEARSEELAEITNMFVLRRTSDILAKYLPSKTEYVVFCRPTKAQAQVYRAITESPLFSSALGSSVVSLGLITVLKKVCNSPKLLLKDDDKGEQATTIEALGTIPAGLLKTNGASGKFQVLDSLLTRIRTTTDEKVVLISNYTSTMDILASLVGCLGHNYLRMDGSTPGGKRQELVDQFNRTSADNVFVFLLSAKVGGVGLNLIGASRLILYDLDWNPATDLQAMARVHRDGQRRPCYIYRLVTQGAIDEKIFQRQVSKTGLADSIVDGKDGVSGFTREELRDIFTLDEGDDCQTHRLLGCACGGKGTPVSPPEDGEDAPQDPPRNDFAMLSALPAEVESREPVETLSLVDEEEIRLHKASQWTKANEYDWKQQEADIERKSRECRDSGGKAKMLSLMQYLHFDTRSIENCPTELQDALSDEDAQEHPEEPDPVKLAIEDAVLRSTVREGRIGFVFTKLSV